MPEARRNTGAVETAPEDAAAVEPRRDAPEDAPPESPDVAIEAPEADVAEQRTEVVAGEADQDAAVWEPVPDGVDPADATAQRRVVASDEDEYR